MILNIPIISEINQIISPYFAFVFLFLLAVAIIFFSLYISAKKKINMLKNTDLTIKYHIVKQGEPSKPNNPKKEVKNVEPNKTNEGVLNKELVKPLPSYALTPDPLKNISNLIDSQNANSDELVKSDLSKDTALLPSSMASNNESSSKVDNVINNKGPFVNTSAKEGFSDVEKGIKTQKMDLVNKKVDSLGVNEKSNGINSNIKKEEIKNEPMSMPHNSNKNVEDSKVKESIKEDNKGLDTSIDNSINKESNSSNIKKEEIKNEPMSMPHNSDKNVEDSKVKESIKEDNKGLDTSIDNRINKESNSSLISNDFNEKYVEENSMVENAFVSEGDSKKVDAEENNSNIDKLAQIDALKKELENALKIHISTITPELKTDQNTIKKVPALGSGKDINTTKQDNNDNIKSLANTNINNKSPNILDASIKSEGSGKPTNLIENTIHQDSKAVISKKDSLIATPNPSSTDSNSTIANTNKVSDTASGDTSKSPNIKTDNSKDNVNKKAEEKHQKKSKKGKSSGV